MTQEEIATTLINGNEYTVKNGRFQRKEMVNHPSHYGGEDNPYEVIKVIEAMGWGYEFCMGNTLKYLMRSGKKDNNPPIQDHKKAQWYLNRAIYNLESVNE